jgi:hypothetical protein
LVAQEKRGREVICCAEFRSIRGTAVYLSEACCAGFEDLDAAATTSGAA